MKISMWRNSLGAALLAVTLVAAAFAAESGTAAGKVMAVKGNVTAQSQSGATREIATGQEIYVGDRVVTQAGSFAVIEFIDGARATVRPSSELVVNKYAYGSKDDGAVLDLVKGGLRALSGAIAKDNPENFKVKTNVATLGVRGTEFDIRLCEKDCDDEQRRAVNRLPGLQGYGYTVLKN